MKTLRDIETRLAAVKTEMRALFDSAKDANKDIEGEALEKWNALDSERADLEAKEKRARTRDEIDRAAPAKKVEHRGTENGDAWALTPEQRSADFLKAQTGESAEGLSLGKAIHAGLTGNWRGAEAEHRVMGTVVNSTGGYMVPETLSANVIDAVRAKTVVINAGALTLPVNSTSLTVVRVISDPTAAWRTEGEAIAESDATFAAMNIVPVSLAALVRVNAELLDDVPSFSSQLDGQLAAALALELDRAALYGTTLTALNGLRNVANVNEISMGANGAQLADYDKFLDLILAVENANGSPATIVYSPRTKNSLAKLVTGISSDKTKLTPPADFAALRKLTSTQISVTETQGSSNVASTAFLGGFPNMALAIRQNVQIEASRHSSDVFTKNQVHVRAILRADVAVFRPNQFGRLIGILA